jgi:tetratricopeptide repeat protein 8
MNDFILAMSRYKRGKYTETLKLCNEMLARNPKDSAAQTLKLKVLIQQHSIDDTELLDEGAADILLDDNQVQ